VGDLPQPNFFFSSSFAKAGLALPLESFITWPTRFWRWQASLASSGRRYDQKLLGCYGGRHRSPQGYRQIYGCAPCGVSAFPQQWGLSYSPLQQFIG
jgi:hypothetical protein